MSCRKCSVLSSKSVMPLYLCKIDQNIAFLGVKLWHWFLNFLNTNMASSLFSFVSLKTSQMIWRTWSTFQSGIEARTWTHNHVQRTKERLHLNPKHWYDQHYQVSTFSSICVQVIQEAECWTKNEVSEEKEHLVYTRICFKKIGWNAHTFLQNRSRWLHERKTIASLCINSCWYVQLCFSIYPANFLV